MFVYVCYMQNLQTMAMQKVSGIQQSYLSVVESSAKLK